MKYALSLLTFALLLAAAPDAWSQNLKLSDYTTNSVVFTNQFVAFTNAARVHSISVQNSSASDAWLQVFDANAVKTAGDAVEISPLKFGSGQTAGFDWGNYTVLFRRGCVIHASTTDRTVTNSTASFKMTVVYQR